MRKDPFVLVHVDPNSITRTISIDDPSLTGNSIWHLGSVSGGDWDLNGVSVREHGHVFSILKQLVRDGRSIDEIPEFNENLKKIESGLIIDSSTSQEEYIKRWDKLTELYRIVRSDGYKTQEKLHSGDYLDEVKIQIGRGGELLLEEGLHRLAIAQLLELDEIPVLVSRRHARWNELREKIISIILQRGFFHQPFNHPDLDNLPYLYGNELHSTSMYGNERWDFIVNSLPLSQGTLLDIGSYFGYFVHRFENLGFECVALEPDPENVAVLKRYRDMKGKNFAIWEQSLFDIESFDFDIVLALNIFHHLVKSEHDFQSLVTFLRKMQCKAMYFEPAQNPPGYYKSFTDEEFIVFVTENSGLKRARRLGRAKEGRNVYLLTV